MAVYPSLYEGFGLPVLESMACGAPTIASDNSSLREILPRDARFEPSDPEAIAQAMTRALTDGPFRQRLSAIARQEQPSWDSVADKAAAAFEALLRRRKSHPAWRRRPYLALVGARPELAAAVGAVAYYDLFTGEAQPAAPGPAPGPVPFLPERALPAAAGAGALPAAPGASALPAGAGDGASGPCPAQG